MCFNREYEARAAGDDVQKTKALRDILGVTHVAGKYCLTKRDYLNEGADQILALGSRVIKIWFYAKRHEHPKNVYSYNSDWPEVNTLVEGAQLPYFQALFNKPFSTYILVVTSLGRVEDYWRNGITDQQAEDETKQFYELTKYLLNKYAGSGKTFILQHWEGDWMVRDKVDPDIDPKPESLANMVIWLNARQAGVNKARQEIGCDGVNVYHAAEVNRVVSSMEQGRTNMVTHVLPHIRVDLISYSAWDSAVEDWNNPESFKKALDYIAEKVVDSEVFGNRNVYLGEFGWPENLYGIEGVKKAVPQAVTTAINWGCPYIVYWQLYCNDLGSSEKSPPIHNNEDVRGFWLIRPDGSKSWLWHYFSNLLNPAENGKKQP
ncbi:MAG: hypothetical protein A2Y10_10205 [Planctomycetes bacterium GWF2_41_51]|nr:MAG: hypothetical protein A2Y10_10205 [Planctomycetes bacterium GWF2_41_51]HBG27688.1 hypothetical protein [Phycisphaerales bacterium]